MTTRTTPSSTTPVSRRPDRVRGPAHDQFWDHCSRRELRIQRCRGCAHLSWPPTPTCERCGGAELTWEQMAGTGTVVSWCTFERRYYAELDVPWDTILVELDEGPLFISNPLGFTNDDITVGMPVRVDFVPCEDGAGPFLLPVFASGDRLDPDRVDPATGRPERGGKDR